MLYAYWIPEATDTHPDYVILVDFPHQKWLSEHPSVVPYTAVHVFYSNMISEQLVCDLNIPHTHQQYAALIYSNGCVR
jgi:hypothetical protein